MHVVALTGIKWESREHYDRFLAKAWSAVLEPFSGLNKKSKDFISLKVEQMENKTLKPACQNSFAEKILLIGYFFINELLDRNYMDIPEGSNLREVTDHLLSLIDLEDEVTQKRMVSAEKQARKWLEILQKKGYYK